MVVRIRPPTCGLPVAILELVVYRDPTGCLTAFYFSPFEVRDDSNPSGDGLPHLSRIKLGGAATVPEWKWEEISMDFIIGLPRTQSGHDSIWVIVDHLTKVAHFIPVRETYQGPKLAELYMTRIVCLHGVPKKIVSDRGTQFTSRFWERLHDSLDTQLNFSSAYHPQTDGQTERVNQI